MLNKATIVLTICVAFFGGFSSADECIGCSSTTDANCAQNPGILKSSPCNSNDRPNCYTRVVGGITYRGCVSELDQGVLATCMNDSFGQSCMICENANGIKGCNNAVFPLNRLRCHTCMENDLKGNCYTGTGFAFPCKTYAPEDRCYIRKTTKSIERGCLSETTKCANTTHCKICDGDGCNNYMGNSTEIPLAPNSANTWNSATAMVLILVPALISLQLTQ